MEVHPLTDFSQSGEQATILEWADRWEHDAGHQGRWLDLGAADGETASNTRALALRGWSGVAIEPAALLFDKLAKLYPAPEVECVQAAIVTEGAPRLLRFHLTDDLLSTSEDDYMQKWADAGVSFTQCHVATVTVSELLAAFPGPYDMVSIDVEGGTLPIWDALRRADAFSPGALAVIEAEDGMERWEIQTACLEGWARRGVTPNNVLLEYIRPQA